MEDQAKVMTDKHELFCQEYLIDLNATRAYISVFNDVTYGSARSLSSKLLADINIYTRIKELIEERKDRVQVSQDFVIRGLIEVANKCQQAEPVMVFDPSERCMVHAKDEDGKAIYTFDSSGANKAYELLGKHLGTFEQDNKQKQPVINVGYTNTDDSDV